MPYKAYLSTDITIYSNRSAQQCTHYSLHIRVYNDNYPHWQIHHHNTSIELEACNTQKQHNNNKLQETKQIQQDQIAKANTRIEKEHGDEPYLVLLRGLKIATASQTVITKAMMVEYFQQRKEEDSSVLIESKLVLEKYREKFECYIAQHNIL